MWCPVLRYQCKHVQYTEHANNSIVFVLFMLLLSFSDGCRWQVTCWCFVRRMHFHDAANCVTVNSLPHDACSLHMASHTKGVRLLCRYNRNMKCLQPTDAVSNLKQNRKHTHSYTVLLNTVNNDIACHLLPDSSKRIGKLNLVLATMQNFLALNVIECIDNISNILLPGFRHTHYLVLIVGCYRCLNSFSKCHHRMQQTWLAFALFLLCFKLYFDILFCFTIYYSIKVFYRCAFHFV